MNEQKCTAINKEKAVSILNGMLTVKILGLDFGGNRGQVAEVVVFATVGDRFEVFGISTVGDADTGDLPLLCHVYCLLFFHNGIVGKVIPGDPAALFDKTNDLLCVGIYLGNLIQRLPYKFLSIHIHRSFLTLVFTKE